MTAALLFAIGTIFVLLLLSAFFSGSETALTAASRARIHQLAEEGDRRAVIVRRLQHERDRLIGAIEARRNIPLERFIYALGIPQVGQATAGWIARHYQTLDRWRSARSHPTFRSPARRATVCCRIRSA